MISTLMMWDVIQKIIFNTIFVSIPEEAVWTMITLVVTHDFSFLQNDNKEERRITKREVLKVLFVTVVVAVVLNVLRYTSASFNIILPTSIILMFIMVVLVYRLWDYGDSLKSVGEAFLGVMLGITIISVAEFSYIPFILNSTGISVEELNNNLLLNFLITLPGRLIQYSILAFLLVRMATILRANVIKPIFESRFLTGVTLTLFFFNVVFMFLMCGAVGYSKILASLSAQMQIIMILGIISIPVVNILGWLWGVYYIKEREATREKELIEELDRVVAEKLSCTSNENCDNIVSKVVDMQKKRGKTYKERKKEE